MQELRYWGNHISEPCPFPLRTTRTMLLLKQMCTHFCRAIFLGRSLHLPNAMCFSSWRICKTNFPFPGDIYLPKYLYSRANPMDICSCVLLILVQVPPLPPREMQSMAITILAYLLGPLSGIMNSAWWYSWKSYLWNLYLHFAFLFKCIQLLLRH